MGRRLAALAVLASLVGCGQTLTASATLVEPAAVPVRAYPEIWLAGGFLQEDEVALDEAALALETDGKHRVVRVEPSELEARRRAGEIPATAAVLMIDVRIEEDVRQDWDMRPVRICGPYGCTTQYEQVPTNVPWVRGSARLRVFEGPTARLLQRHVVRTDLYGGDPVVLRQRVAERLAKLVAEAVSVVERAVEVELLQVKDPGVEHALAQVRAGDWQAGRKGLEAAARSDSVRQLSAEDRARVFYDLGMARRFAPSGGPTEQDFDAATRAFQHAARLDPRPLYADALTDLKAHRAAQARLVAQREAAEHNFALDAQGGAMPPPPPSYLPPGERQSPPIPPPPEPVPVPEEVFEPE